MACIKSDQYLTVLSAGRSTVEKRSLSFAFVFRIFIVMKYSKTKAFRRLYVAMRLFLVLQAKSWVRRNDRLTWRTRRKGAPSASTAFAWTDWGDLQQNVPETRNWYLPKYDVLHWVLTEFSVIFKLYFARLKWCDVTSYLFGWRPYRVSGTVKWVFK